MNLSFVIFLIFFVEMSTARVYFPGIRGTHHAHLSHESSMAHY